MSVVFTQSDSLAWLPYTSLATKVPGHLHAGNYKSYLHQTRATHESSNKKRRKQSNPVRLVVDTFPEYPAAIIPQNHLGSDFQLNAKETFEHNEHKNCTNLVIPTPTHSPIEDVDEMLPLNLTKTSEPDNSVPVLKKESTPHLKDNSTHNNLLETNEKSPKLGSQVRSHLQFNTLYDVVTNNFSDTYGTTVHRSGGSRIFNPEAFCTICNKEFCNKYFLKTHKANKHGLYGDTNGLQGNCGNSGQPLPGPLSLSWSLGRNTKAQANLLKFSQSHTCIKDSAAFCNVCQKEFCNKYFLKRHKLKMHGIVADNGRIEGQLAIEGRGNTENGHVVEPHDSIHGEAEQGDDDDDSGVVIDDNMQKSPSNRIPDIPVPTPDINCKNNSSLSTDSNHTESSTSKSIIQKVHNIPLGLRNKPPMEEDEELKHYSMFLKLVSDNSSDTFCTICQSTFDESDTLALHLLRDHSPLISGLKSIFANAADYSSSPAASQLGLVGQTAFCQYDKHKSECESYSNHETALLTTKSSSKTAKNFCLICNKELCNKYFMKTHMSRMHGISTGAVTGTSIGGVTCEICNKELCSKYFLKVHRRNCHGVLHS